VTQVFLAGMVVVAARMGWDNHIGLGHSLAGPLLFMLVTMYLGRLPGSMKRLTWLLFGVYVLQADVLIFLRVQAPVLSGTPATSSPHAVNSRRSGQSRAAGLSIQPAWTSAWGPSITATLQRLDVNPGMSVMAGRHPCR
jgi:hypothetical protein